MKKLAVPRLALVLSATIAIVSACAPGDPGSAIAAPLSFRVPTAPSFAIGAVTKTQAQVCIDPTSAPGTYTFTTKRTSPAQSGDGLVGSLILTLPVAPGGISCGVVFTRTYVAADGSSPVGKVTISAATTAVAGGPFSYTCADGDASGLVCGSPSGTTNSAVAGAGNFHGSLVTFKFSKPTPPPPPPPPPTTCKSDDSKSDDGKSDDSKKKSSASSSTKTTTTKSSDDDKNKDKCKESDKDKEKEKEGGKDK